MSLKPSGLSDLTASLARSNQLLTHQTSFTVLFFINVPTHIIEPSLVFKHFIVGLIGALLLHTCRGHHTVITLFNLQTMAQSYDSSD